MPTDRLSGNINELIRLNDTVYRTLRPASETIQKLLGHFERMQVPGVPRPRGISEAGYEIVSFIEGESPQNPWPARTFHRSTLIGIAHLLRRMHDASTTFESPPDPVWGDCLPGKAEVICHNDLGPYNLVFGPAGQLGIIDFDRAAPGARSWDLAYAAYRFVPFCAYGKAPRYFASPTLLAERVCEFCTAYGWPSPASLYEQMERRLAHEIAWLRDSHPQDLAARKRLLSLGHDNHYIADLEFLRQHRVELEDLTSAVLSRLTPTAHSIKLGTSS